MRPLRRLSATDPLPHHRRRGHRCGVDRIADVYLRSRRRTLARVARVALPAGHHGRIPGRLSGQFRHPPFGRDGTLRLRDDATDLDHGEVARHVRRRDAPRGPVLPRAVLHSRESAVAASQRQRRAGPHRAEPHLSRPARCRAGDRRRTRDLPKERRTAMARAARTRHPASRGHRRLHRHPRAVHGCQRRALLRTDDLRECRTVERRLALFAGAGRHGEHAHHCPCAGDHRPRRSPSNWYTGVFRA